MRTIGQLCRAISSQLRHISTIGKNLLSSNIFSTCPHNMANFGPLAAEIGSLVWCPANFTWFCVLAALLHGTYSSGHHPNFAVLNRGRHQYSAGRPSRWASAHILVFVSFSWVCSFLETQHRVLSYQHPWIRRRIFRQGCWTPATGNPMVNRSPLIHFRVRRAPQSSPCCRLPARRPGSPQTDGELLKLICSALFPV